MSNTEVRPDEVVCGQGEGTHLQVITPRDVPLGGPRAMTVRRTLPSRERSLIGAWCFVDHYGPDDVSATGGMVVPPHPHTGLQTVSWLFTGEIEHRDSAGNVAMVRPREVNLMTGGRGISHSENTLEGGEPMLHGAQLWVALPDGARDARPGFAHHVPAPVTGHGWQVRVFLGTLLGDASPVQTHTPLLGAEILLEPGTSLTMPVDPAFEHGVLVDAGGVAVACAGGESSLLAKDHLGYLPPGAGSITVEAGGAWTRLLLLGGPPFGEQIIMWWNFVGRTHEEIVGYRQEWQDQITRGGRGVVADSQDVHDGRFGIVAGNHQPPIPAPPMPNARLRSRG
jgi:redox-sensitive bicupin YhaK (pirin superfamily)